MTEQKLEKMYDAVIDGKELTTKELNACGLDSKQINGLIEQGMLKRVKKGYYEFANVNNLFAYGKKLLITSGREKAYACFLKCYEINPTDTDICVSCLQVFISEQNYEKVIDIIDVLFEKEDKKTQVDCNFYLFMLSFITSLPDKYQEYSKNLTLNDMLMETTEDTSSFNFLENAVKTEAFQHNFSKAVNLMNDHASKGHRKRYLREIVVQTLLFQAMGVSKKASDDISSLIRLKKYDELIQHLNRCAISRRLSPNETIILQMTTDLVNIMNTKKIPIVHEKTSSNKLITLLKNREYIRALERVHFNKKNPTFNVGINAIFQLILSDIVDQINKVDALGQKQELETTRNSKGIIKKNAVNKSSKETTLESQTQRRKQLPKYYGITSIFEIAQLVASGTRVDDACQMYDLSDEQRLLVYLLFAREYYTLGVYSLADGCMKVIEKSRNKTSQVKCLYNEIKRNKKFYVNRNEEETPLALALKGNK